MGENPVANFEAICEVATNRVLSYGDGDEETTVQRYRRRPLSKARVQVLSAREKMATVEKAGKARWSKKECEF